MSLLDLDEKLNEKISFESLRDIGFFPSCYAMRESGPVNIYQTTLPMTIDNVDVPVFGTFNIKHPSDGEYIISFCMRSYILDMFHESYYHYIIKNIKNKYNISGSEDEIFSKYHNYSKQVYDVADVITFINVVSEYYKFLFN